MNTEKKQKEIVQKAYSQLAKDRENWPDKYNIGLQLYKMLCDYTLLGKVNLFNKRVLNIGCFEPIDEIFWINLVGEWHALDINEVVIKVSKKLASESLPVHLYSKLKFIVGDVTNLELESSKYDVITSFSTIDHIPGKENRVKALKEIYRVLKSGGYFVITVPNRWDLKYSHNSNKLQKLGKSSFGYEYQFSPIELRKMLRKCGFSIIDCASTNYNPHSFIDRFFKKLMLHKILIYFGTRFGYLCKKI